MTPVINLRTFDEPPFNEREILRYAGCRQEEVETLKLVRSCIKEAEDIFSYKVCYTKAPVTVKDDDCDFGAFCVNSKNLAKNLSGCREAVIFAATVGVGIDRLITRYTRLSPARALIFQAIGAERIEALCDAFCNSMETEFGSLRPRFSPGYGDVPLTVQNDIFELIDPSRKIGLCLNDSLLMAPTKSVTAFAGIE